MPSRQQHSTTVRRKQRKANPVANFLNREKQIQVLRLLSEGNSIRSTMRLTGIEKKTIMRIVVRFGNPCREFLDDSLANLSLRHVQCDEIWTFVRMKERPAGTPQPDNSKIGDQYLYTALDTDTKLLACFAVGKRTSGSDSSVHCRFGKADGPTAAERSADHPRSARTVGVRMFPPSPVPSSDRCGTASW